MRKAKTTAISRNATAIHKVLKDATYGFAQRYDKCLRNHVDFNGEIVVDITFEKGMTKDRRSMAGVVLATYEYGIPER